MWMWVQYTSICTAKIHPDLKTSCYVISLSLYTAMRRVKEGRQERYTLTVDILSGSLISTFLRNILSGSDHVNTEVSFFTTGHFLSTLKSFPARHLKWPWAELIAKHDERTLISMHDSKMLKSCQRLANLQIESQQRHFHLHPASLHNAMQYDYTMLCYQSYL